MNSISFLVVMLLLLSAAIAIGRYVNSPKYTKHSHEPQDTSWGKPFGGGSDTTDTDPPKP